MVYLYCINTGLKMLPRIKSSMAWYTHKHSRKHPLVFWSGACVYGRPYTLGWGCWNRSSCGGFFGGGRGRDSGERKTVEWTAERNRSTFTEIRQNFNYDQNMELIKEATLMRRTSRYRKTTAQTVMQRDRRKMKRESVRQRQAMRSRGRQAQREGER